MSGYYDPYGRSQRRPTIAEYNRLIQVYRKLQADYERLTVLYRQSEQAHAAAKQQGAQMQELAREMQSRLHRAETTLQDAETRIAVLQHDLDNARASDVQSEFMATEGSNDFGGENRGEDVADWQDAYLRLQAEMDNFKKRQERRFAQIASEDRRNILQDMLPVADHLELGLRHMANETDAAARLQGYHDNLQATLQAFWETLRRHGVVRIQAEGAEFNPSLHEAVGTAPSADIAEGQIIDVVQSGYTDNGNLLRPARVIVSAGAPPSAD